ncbi:hypothetical protein ACFWXO_45185, partial [Kitasatospora sp. NPDC059088]|uniref:hypothetical protein n=1 Tax=Kitasatospora sp. NPDC059088 TaxID=3346722 RepID=UPI0036C9B0B7
WRGPRPAAGSAPAGAPDELAGYRDLLWEIATVVADANEEGGILGLGARTRVPNEVAAMEAVRAASLGEPEAATARPRARTGPRKRG